MVLIDEDELDDLRVKAFWFKQYYDRLGQISEKYYPDTIITDPICEAQRRELLFFDIVNDIQENRKKFFKRGH